MKKMMVIFCLAVVLISSGCMQRRATGEVEVVDYHKGTQGLVMNFIKNLPPDEIWEGSEFIIGLELRNLGANKISNAVIKVTGFDLEYTEPKKEEEKTFSLEGRSPGYPEGDYQRFFSLEQLSNLPGAKYVTRRLSVLLN